MNANIESKVTLGRPSATATLLIASDPEARLKPKPAFRDDFEISREEYDRLPAAFTLTELPLPAVVAADSIENYETHLAAIPEDERAELDLNEGDRWGDSAAVRRYVNRALKLAFDGEHFTVAEGAAHIYIEPFYLHNPTHTFSIADKAGEVLDFYSSPTGFEQPISIEARISVTRPARIEAFGA